MYCRIRISAISREGAENISKALLKKKLIAGAMIYKGDCYYWWNDKIVERLYWNIGAFSLMKHKDKIIEEVRKLHSDKCPIVAFNKIDGNKEFLEWIKTSVD